jgi:dolichyl-phosphate beta-glucosyltransferase
MPEICIIIPFYNEEKRFDVEKFENFSQKHTAIYFCLVNDGSKDNTLFVLEGLQSQNERIKVLNLPSNKGKAEAIRLGMNHVQQWMDFKYLAFLDADFSAPPEVIPFMLSVSEGRSILMGSRIMYLGMNISRNPLRHYIGRIFATLASEILKLPIYDTQCGAKIFSKEIVAVAFNEPFITTWLFDLEIIMRIIKEIGWVKFLQISKEVPLYEWVEKGGSKVKLSYMFRLPIDLMRIRLTYGKVKQN